MHDTLIILAAGASSRMKKSINFDDIDLTKEEITQANERSKGLIGIGSEGRPMIDYLLYNAKKAGYINIYIIINPQGNLFKSFYGDKQEHNDFHDLKISFAFQHIPKGRVKPYGTADALLQTLEQYPQLNQTSYTICNSDNLYSEKALFLLRKTKSPNTLISYDRDTLDFEKERISSFSLITFTSENYFVDILEKPTPDQIKILQHTQKKLCVSMNIFKFNGKMVYPYVKACLPHPIRNEKELPTVVLNMAKDLPNEILCIPLSEHVPDLTSKNDIPRVKAFLTENYRNLEW